MKQQLIVRIVMTTKTELLNKIAELQAQINTMPDDPKPESETGVIYTEPDECDEAYFLDSEGEIEKVVYSKLWRDEFELGNLFHDKASAELESRRREVKHRLKAYLAERWVETPDALYLHVHAHGSITCTYSYVNEFKVARSFAFDLSELREHFTEEELRLAITGSL